jgi:hypothetical protein
MNKLLLAALIALQGCAAYNSESIAKFSDFDLCVTLHDTGSISGVPERNAKAEIERRGGIDCRPHMATYWARVQNLSNAIPRPVSCTSNIYGSQVFTQCN